MCGLELPWPGKLHAHDDKWLLSHLNPRWDLVVSDIGGTVGRVSADRHYGLASRDSAGRTHALREAERLCTDVERLNQAFGRQAVIAVELHSAPLASLGTSDALAESLRELSEWDWGGAQLLIEHCDSLVNEQTPEKGYLGLHDELRALRTLPSIGLSLNWGRSAIELRNADRVIDHVSQARTAGALRALIFSGVAASANAFGEAWSDLHLPFAPTPGFGGSEAESLMTQSAASKALAEAGALDWVGLKLGFRPVDGPVEHRVHMISESIRLLQDAAPK